MNKLYPIKNCIECPAWSYGDRKDYCEKKKKIIPNFASEFPKWCPLEDEKKFSFFRRLIK